MDLHAATLLSGRDARLAKIAALVCFVLAGLLLTSALITMP